LKSKSYILYGKVQNPTKLNISYIKIQVQINNRSSRKIIFSILQHQKEKIQAETFELSNAIKQ